MHVYTNVWPYLLVAWWMYKGGVENHTPWTITWTSQSFNELFTHSDAFCNYKPFVWKTLKEEQCYFCSTALLYLQINWCYLSCFMTKLGGWKSAWFKLNEEKLDFKQIFLTDWLTDLLTIAFCGIFDWCKVIKCDIMHHVIFAA